MLAVCVPQQPSTQQSTGRQQSLGLVSAVLEMLGLITHLVLFFIGLFTKSNQARPEERNES